MGNQNQKSKDDNKGQQREGSQIYQELIEDHEYFFQESWLKSLKQPLFDSQQFIFFYHKYRDDQLMMSKHWSSVNIDEQLKKPQRKNSEQKQQKQVQSSKLKYLIRRGIPLELISKVYLYLSKQYISPHEEVKSDYKECIHSLETTNLHIKKNFEILFQSNQTLEEVLKCQILNKDGMQAIERVLMALKHTEINLEYNPMIVHSCSILLLFLTEEETFFVVKGLIDDSKRILIKKEENDKSSSAISGQSDRQLRWHFLLNEAQLIQFTKSFFRTISDISQSFKTLQAHFQEIGLDELEFFQGLVENMFFGYLNFPTIIKLFSIFLNEGIKIYFRMMYAIIMFNKKDILLLQDTTAVVNMIKNQSLSLSHEQSQSLLKQAFELELQQTTKDLSQFSVYQNEKVNSKRKNYIYQLNVDLGSELISNQQFQLVMDWLPNIIKMTDPQLIYSSNNHGFSLDTLYRIIDSDHIESQYMIMFFKGNNNSIFGVFIDSILKCNSVDCYYGGNETFVFTIFPEFSAFFSTNANDCHIFSNDQMIMIGSGNEGPALYIDSDFNQARTCRSATYNNKLLIGDKSKTDFICLQVEIYTFS